MGAKLQTKDEIFNAAAEIADPDERAAYLREACGNDLPLRGEIEELLVHDRSEDSLLDRSVPGIGATIDRPITEQPGTVIGQYKLLQQIGEGGMGVVFMAEQTEPIQRTVALKIIKPGMDTRQVIARFEAERQAVAMMDHPNIARVIDAGTTATGRPYFVMELVKGVPITKYCDEKHLPLPARLELFVQVCQAVQHAHQKGIIHRDIKPNNVLVAEYDNHAVPKVIDFGVAKATAQRLTERTMFTEFGQVLGTMEYMSPEQSKFNQLDIDTRSDIYSLGVLLYELLAGSTPFEGKRLKEAAFDEMLRIIREEEPPKPSTRLSSIDTLPSVAVNRHTEPARLSKDVRGELDWIVMTALEKDRNRRYETASGFAADIERHLRDEPVEAGPPSAAYRFRKFAKRNKGPVIAGSLILLTLVAGMLGTTMGLIRAEKARQAEAEQRQLALAAAAAAKTAKQTAEAREADAQAILDFVQNKVFAAAGPEGQDGGLGRDVTLRQAVEAALPFVETSFPKQPIIEARLRWTLGNAFDNLGEAGQAAEQFQKARMLFSQSLGPDHPDTLSSMNALAVCYAALGRHADALKLREETLALRKAKLGPDDPLTLMSMTNLANSYDDLGRRADALKLREETLDLYKAKLGPDHPNTLASMNNLANSYDDLGRYADALKLREETLALRKVKLGPDHPYTLTSMNNLAISYNKLGRHADALELHKETLALRMAKLGADHPETLTSMHNLASSYDGLGRYADALKLREETLALRKAKLGPDHPNTLASMNNLASSYDDLGRYADALKLREETLALRKAKLGPDHPNTLASMDNLAISYGKLGRHADALKLHKETLALRMAKRGPDHPETLESMNNLAASYYNLGRYVDALKLFEETLALRKVRLGPDHPNTLSCMYNLANCYASVGRRADALKLREETLALRKVKLGPDHPDTLESMCAVASSLDQLNRSSEALPIIDESLKRAEGKSIRPDVIEGLLYHRLRHLQIMKDAAGCRATAEMLEKLKCTDADSLYNVSCMRAVTAAVIEQDPTLLPADAPRLVRDEADRAMAWLKKAVAAGFDDEHRLKQDADLDALRNREDFQKLVADLKAKTGKKVPTKNESEVKNQEAAKTPN